VSLIKPMLVSGAAGLVDGWAMWCPGCESVHAIDETWQFDGNLDAPTFSPSLLVQYGSRPGDKRCHSFVRAGHWEFLSDCTHALAGQTHPMQDIPEDAL
jgi:hypothetical protein